MRIRGAASNSVTRVPNALKIEASCTPVAPAPMTSIDGGAVERVQASLWVHASSKPGELESAGPAAGADDDLRGVEARGASDSITCGSVNRAGAGVLVERDPGLPEILAQQRVGAHVGGDLPDAIEQPPIVELGLAGGDAVARELGGFADQAGGVRERADGDRSVVGGHSPELVAGDERGRAPSLAARSAATTPAGSGADHHEIVARGAR